MAVTSGYLSEFSLPEIFQFLEQGSKTGLLTLSSVPEKTSSTSENYYIWFRQGSIVAAANRLDNQYLLSLMAQRGWIKHHLASTLSQTYSTQTPIGLYLKAQNFMDAEQLKMLFYTQVMQQICALFTLRDAHFDFNNQGILPMTEMTGLSTSATEVTLAGLRALRDWEALADKLPDATSALIRLGQGRPSMKLYQVEAQVWELANSKTSLAQIAEQIQLSIQKVQQIAFRLIVVGLVEESPLFAAPTDKKVVEEVSRQIAPVATINSSNDNSDKSKISRSFLQNLVGFLRSNT